MDQHTPTLTIIFDGSCGFCTATTLILRSLDWRKRIRLVPFQQPGIPEQYGLTLQQCETSVWAILLSGRKYSGARAISAALDAITVVPIFSLLYLFPLIGPLEEKLYHWVARNRHHFPGVKPYCQRPEARCGS